MDHPRHVINRKSSLHNIPLSPGRPDRLPPPPKQPITNLNKSLEKPYKTPPKTPPEAKQVKRPTPPKSPAQTHRSPGRPQDAPKNNFALLCSECKSDALASSRGAVCFMTNDGRTGAVTRSGLHGFHCKTPSCPNNEELALLAASQPRKYLVSKRHLLRPPSVKRKGSKKDSTGSNSTHEIDYSLSKEGESCEMDQEHREQNDERPPWNEHVLDDQFEGSNLIKDDYSSASRSPSQQSGFFGVLDGMEDESSSLSDDSNGGFDAADDAFTHTDETKEGQEEEEDEPIAEAHKQESNGDAKEASVAGGSDEKDEDEEEEEEEEEEECNSSENGNNSPAWSEMKGNQESAFSKSPCSPSKESELPSGSFAGSYEEEEQQQQGGDDEGDSKEHYTITNGNEAGEVTEETCEKANEVGVIEAELKGVQKKGELARRKRQSRGKKVVVGPNAIEEVVQKLAPKGATSVRVLVEAFETIIISHVAVEDDPVEELTNNNIAAN